MIKFAKSQSTELAYDYSFRNILNPASYYPDLTSANGSWGQIVSAVKWFKLDSISFYDGSNTFLKKAAFSYRQQTTSRLMLDSLKEIGQSGEINPPYKFKYDETALPGYNSRKLDHWGFYNNRDFFTENPRANDLGYLKTDIPAYTSVRGFVTTQSEAGVLTSIKYPTGGITKFDYEPHEYRKIVKRISTSAFTVADTTANIPTGGLRIKKIVNTDAFGNVLTSKEFFYTYNYPTGIVGQPSSGILAGYPQYLDEGQFAGTVNSVSYWYWFDFAIQPLGFTNGCHVTYNEVVEKAADGSYSIYNYSNHDAGSYRDEAVVNGIVMTNHAWKRTPFTSRALERGKLLFRRDYNASNILLKKAKYDYDTSAARYAEVIRLTDVQFRFFGPGPAETEVSSAAYLDYTFPRFLTKETDTLWDQKGANPIVSVKHYRYNNYRLKSIDSMTNSSNVIVKNAYSYPFDKLPGNDPTGVYQEMVDSNVVEPVVELKTTQNVTQMTYIRTNYSEPQPGIYKPQTVEVQQKSNPSETRLRYTNYDSRGNLMTVAKENDAPISYIWNYLQTVPIAQVKNARQSDIAYTSFESDGTGNWNNYVGVIATVTSGAMPPTGKKYYLLTTTATLVKTGLTSTKTYVLSYWTQNAAAFSIAGTVSGFPVRGRSIGSWNYFEHQITGVTSVTISGSGLLDEVRLYPADAQMTTYSYDPGVGRTSANDENNRITYYEYDGLQRLNLIRDQDRNIIKKLSYKYADPTVYYNTRQTREFQKNNCTGCQIGNYFTYVVADSTFSSTDDQDAADKLATADIDANGQTWANSQSSGCHTPTNTTLNVNNSSSVVFTIQLHNNCTGVNYNYSIPGSAANYAITPVPEGYYTVTIAPVPCCSGPSHSYRLDGVFASGTGPIDYYNVWMLGTVQLIIIN